jgi:hypothetical protein
MIDIAALPPGTPTASDFAFKIGNDNNPAGSGWSSIVPSPTISLRRGAGTGGSDRIELIWSDNAIQNTWLQITVKADAQTGLASDDVSYFGNQIGETGNNPANAFVDAGDFVAVRDHPADFLHRALPSNPYDFNHDSFVNATDLVIARDNTNNFLNAIKRITPPVGASAPSSVVAGSVASASAASKPVVVASPPPKAQPAVKSSMSAPVTSFSAALISPSAAVATQPRRPRKRHWWA